MMKTCQLDAKAKGLSKARVLVTGGAGFIGSQLVSQLVRAGAKVTVVDSLANGRKENLSESIRSGARLMVADIRDARAMGIATREQDIIYHLACMGVRHSIHSPAENHDVNATGTLILLQKARAAGAKRFVHVSSSEIYGTARQAPMSEDCPPFPHTVYGASKLAGECYARAFHDTYGFPSVVVRPFNSYGPHCHHEGDSGEVIPKFILRALAGKPLVVFGDGRQTRDFMYVADTARAILLAGVTPKAIGETINVGSGTEITINRLARVVARAVGCLHVRVKHVEPRPGDVRRLFADASKARLLLGFKPSVSLEDGLALLKNWYLATGMSPEQMLKAEVERNWRKR